MTVGRKLKPWLKYQTNIVWKQHGLLFALKNKCFIVGPSLARAPGWFIGQAGGLGIFVVDCLCLATAICSAVFLTHCVH